MTQVETQVEQTAAGTPTRPGRALVAAIVGGAALVVGYFAFGMPGMPGMDDGAPEAGGGSMASMDHESMAFMRLDPDAFAARVADPSTFVVNVHTSYTGEIDGTDAFIAFDEIAGDSRLPNDKDAAIALYCESGRMSEMAADALVAAGYTDVVDLEGGLEAWQAAGMPVTGRAGADN